MTATFYADLQPLEPFNGPIFTCDWGSMPLPRPGDMLDLHGAVELQATIDEDLKRYLSTKTGQEIDWNCLEVTFIRWDISTVDHKTEVDIHLAFEQDYVDCLMVYLSEQAVVIKP